MTDKLLIFSNCQGIARFDEWEKTGGTLLGNKSIGCGINSLCFLGVFTKELGEHLVKNILPSGTTFLDILYYLNELSSSKVIYTEHVYNLSTLPDLTNTLNLLHQLMPENSCTIVKLNRPSDMLGHTIVFSKENNILYTFDPQAMKKWERRDDTHDSSIFSAWKAENHISLSAVFDSSSISSLKPNINTLRSNENISYTIAKFPKVNNIKILQWSITDSQIKGWKCLSNSPGDKTDCALNSLSFLNVIERNYAKILSIEANKTKTPLSINKLRKELGKVTDKKSFIVFKYFNDINDAVIVLNNELLNGHGTLLLINNTKEGMGHALIIRKNGKYNYNIIDTQSDTVFLSITQFVKTNVFDQVFLGYNVGLVKSSTVTRKYKPNIRRPRVGMRKTLKTPYLVPHQIKVEDYILTKTNERKLQRQNLIEQRRKTMNQTTKKTFEFTPPLLVSSPIVNSSHSPIIRSQSISL